jgi:hypothetical protein
MSEVATAGPCTDCFGLVDRVGKWASRYSGYNPAAWNRVLGPHPHLDRTDGTPFRCRACGCCWSLNENPECGYVSLDQLSEREYRGRFRPARWNPAFWEGHWGAVVLLYAPLLSGSVGLAAVLAGHSANEIGSGSRSWSAVFALSGLAVAAGWGLVRAVRGR